MPRTAVLGSKFLDRAKKKKKKKKKKKSRKTTTALIMPFSLTNASAVFQSFINTLLYF